MALLVVVIAGCTNGDALETYDVVIVGGRVMDPETNFDGVRNVGIRNGRIVTITQERGRMQEGMVADIVVFDAENVTENATFKTGSQGVASTGIPYVLVHGTVVVKDSKVLKDVYPGQPLRFPVEENGRYEPISAESWKEANLIETKEGLEIGTLDD